MSVRRQTRVILALPGTVVIVIPTVMSILGGVRPGWNLPSPFDVILVVVGIGLALVGIVTVTVTIGLFSRARGTLAPWDPPKDLVIGGPYRYVRNPMISGIFAILAGAAAVLGSWWILGWFLLFVLAQNIYIRLDEEPKLVTRFGRPYEEYRRAVPRWIPRLPGALGVAIDTRNPAPQ
ncbi:isoprenylcysteine carboxylmethyltransferase family protein [Nocardia sp. NBC_01730]|uniref:methyltransferase family protein n=1 Tax=Nocardia sp. NBC_01730 TaxID=2975998 RepID=UPI002E0EDA21|nr:isoprenylcysteine carboxylmethyltransferase family protein [Nocardia sp. NBC_01730]